MNRTIAGVGLGLRRAFARDLLGSARTVDWIEVTPENWLRFGGARRRLLEECLERWPAVSHSVSLSVGGPDPLDDSLLQALAALCRRTSAPFFSDHLCYSGVNGAPLHELLPLPFSEEAAAHVAQRARIAQDRVGVPLVLENATFYAHMPGGTMDEGAFLRAVIDQSGCDLLLDVNNVYVNCKNHGGDPYAFIDAVPLERVRQLHVAGHTVKQSVIIDTHIGPVIDEVWALYRHTLQRAGRLIPTLIEWDQDIPPVDVVLDEVDAARRHARQALGPEAAP